MFRDFVNESKEFSKLEDNPLIYTLVIAKLANNCPDETKKDEVLKKVIEKAETVAKQFDTRRLNQSTHRLVCSAYLKRQTKQILRRTFHSTMNHLKLKSQMQKNRLRRLLRFIKPSKS